MTEQGWVEQPEPGLVEEGQSVQAGAGAAQAPITAAPPGDTANGPDQIPDDQATAEPVDTP